MLDLQKKKKNISEKKGGGIKLTPPMSVAETAFVEAFLERFGRLRLLLC